jgi:hypothetical protein
MKKLLLLAPCIALTSACSGAGNNSSANSADTSTNGVAATTNTAVPGPVAASRGGATSTATLRPGRWETTAQVQNIEAPDAPPEALAQMRAQLEQRRTQCWTQDDVSGLAEKLANPGDAGSNCRFDRRTFEGGTIDVAGTCSSGPQNVQMTMTGSFTPETMQASMNVNASGRGQGVRMSVSMNGRRIGDC